MTDTVAVAAIGAFATVTTALLAYLTVLAQRNQRNLAETKASVVQLEKHTDGMQATIERLATSAGIVVGRAQVKDDMQAGADSPLILPTAHVTPQKVEIVNPEPVPVAIHEPDEKKPK